MKVIDKTCGVFCGGTTKIEGQKMFKRMKGEETWQINYLKITR